MDGGGGAGAGAGAGSMEQKRKNDYIYTHKVSTCRNEIIWANTKKLFINIPD